MPFVTIAERPGFEEGFKQGLLEGLLIDIEACLKLRFGAEGPELMPELRELHASKLLGKILDAIVTAGTPVDLRRVWTRKRRPKKAKPE